LKFLSIVDKCMVDKCLVTRIQLAHHIIIVYQMNCIIGPRHNLYTGNHTSLVIC
jgi:hypothetical protein